MVTSTNEPIYRIGHSQIDGQLTKWWVALSNGYHIRIREGCGDTNRYLVSLSTVTHLIGGKDHEAEAFQIFNKHFFNEWTYYGGETYVFIPYGDYSGFSPDGLSEDAILEIKCPYNSAIHLKNFTITDADSLKSVHPEYFWQMQLGMLATDLPKGYFVSYDPRMPEGKQMHIAEIERHDLQFEIDEKLEAAWELLQTILHS
jgi:hypothetical protein